MAERDDEPEVCGFPVTSCVFAGPRWSPIATAPRDGTSVLAWDDCGNYRVVRWYQPASGGVGGWQEGGEWLDPARVPTLWQPLPPPP